MDTVLLSLTSLYIFVLLGGGIAALVMQLRKDARSDKTNPLEPWRLKWSDALLIAWGLVFGMLALAIALSHIHTYLGNSNHRLITQAVGFQGGLLLLLLAILYFYPSRPLLVLSPHRQGIWGTLQQAVVQLLAAIILLIPVNLCWRGILLFIKSLGLGDLTQEQDLVALFSKALTLPVGALITLLVVAVVIAPIAEEILFRGLFYRFLKSRISPRWAMLVSALCFGALHGNVASFIPLVFLGMILTRAYENTGSLKVPILMHALFNANTTLLLISSPFVQQASERVLGP